MQATFPPHKTSCKMRKAMNSDGRNPKCPLSTTYVLLSIQLSKKYKIRMSNLCARHDTVAELKHRNIVTCMRVNAICTILQLTLFTHEHHLRVRLGATKGTYLPIVTHNILIIIVLLCRCGPKRGLGVPNPNSRGHAIKRGLRVPNPNSRGYATKRGLRVLNPNSRGHATKRGL